MSFVEIVWVLALTVTFENGDSQRFPSLYEYQSYESCVAAQQLLMKKYTLGVDSVAGVITECREEYRHVH